MPNRTQIVCLHEGERGSSIDEVFINRLIRTLKPAWIRPFGSNWVRLVPKGSRTDVINAMPAELKACLDMGGHTTLMVWADLDHDMADGDALRRRFLDKALEYGISEADFNNVVFIFSKDRLENWIEFLIDGSTDESLEGDRIRSNRKVADAAVKLAHYCTHGSAIEFPSSLKWSCRNWRALVDRMK